MFNNSILANAFHGGPPIVPNFDITQYYWVSILGILWDPVYTGAGTTSNNFVGTPSEWYSSSNSPRGNCRGWTSNSNDIYGASFTYGTVIGGRECYISQKILCAVPK